MDLIFTLKDLIYLFILFATILGSWFKLKSHNDKQDMEMKNIREKLKHLYQDNKEQHSSYEEDITDIKEDIHKLQTDFKVMHTKLDALLTNQNEVLSFLKNK
jgi:septal ring factor EnvC (AmiA/AmiB activator)